MTLRKVLTPEAGTKALRLALKPLVRLAIRNSLQFMEFVEILKSVFLDVGAEELRGDGEKINVSRLSVMTGVHRKDATRLFRDGGEIRRPSDTIARVVGQWRQSPRYSSQPGKPRVLSCEGLESEFAELVKEITSDIAPYTVLNELERRGMMERTVRGAKLVALSHVSAKRDYVEGFEMLASDVEDLLTAGTENIVAPKSVRNLQLKTEFDNIPKSKVAEIRSWLLEEGSRFHARVEKYLAQFDRDVTRGDRQLKEDRSAARVAFGSFSVVDSTNDEGQR